MIPTARMMCMMCWWHFAKVGGWGAIDVSVTMIGSMALLDQGTTGADFDVGQDYSVPTCP